MKRVTWLAIRVLLATIAVIYLTDWAILRVKISHGTGYGAIQVDQYLGTALKGNKEEYDYMGATPEPCAHSIFPHGAAPCWWLAKHTSHWE
jgi:hypothetical protein